MILEDALSDINVLHPEDRDEAPPQTQVGWPAGWWAVQDTDGIIAYFAHEVDACSFRLTQVNLILNGYASLEKRGISKPA